MPTYEYECKKCEHRFDAFQSMSEEPLKTCPECGGRVRRLIGGGAGIIFKGSGFYSTDSRSGSNGSSKSTSTSTDTSSDTTEKKSKSDDSKSTSTKSETKTEKKTAAKKTAD